MGRVRCWDSDRTRSWQVSHPQCSLIAWRPCRVLAKWEGDLSRLTAWCMDPYSDNVRGGASVCCTISLVPAVGGRWHTCSSLRVGHWIQRAWNFDWLPNSSHQERRRRAGEDVQA